MIRCALVCLLLIVGCGGDAPVDSVGSAPTASVAAPAGPHELVVCATASLRRAFEAIAERYEQDHPGAAVTLRSDGGAQLLQR
jgi:ABC-type molybdate transport system substrate-binding protein